MTDLGNHDETAAGWHFRVRLKRNDSERDPPGIKYIGFAKRGPFVTEAVGMAEPGEIHFAFGATEEAVLAELKREVLH